MISNLSLQNVCMFVQKLKCDSLDKREVDKFLAKFFFINTTIHSDELPLEPFPPFGSLGLGANVRSSASSTHFSGNNKKAEKNQNLTLG